MPDNYLTKDLLQKYLSSECTPEVESTIKKYLIDPSNRKEVERFFEEIWNETEETATIAGIDYSASYHQILNRILEPSSVVSIESQKGKAVSRIRRITHHLSKAAAILFIPVILFSIWQVDRNLELKESTKSIASTELTVPYGSRLKTELPDGSTVWLNGGSTLKYPQVFTGDKRIIEFSGEGYFDIIKNEDAPFIINTDAIDVRVLGTRFNLTSYPEERLITTTLVEGSVRIINKHKKTKQTYTLQPSEKYTFNTGSGQEQIEMVTNTFKDIAWIEGKLMFDDDPMTEVISRIEKWYNVEIEYDEGFLSDYFFTATFHHETLPQVLDLISLAVPVEVYSNGWEKNPDNSFKTKTYFLNKKDLK